MPRGLHEALSFTAIAVEESAPCKAVALTSTPFPLPSPSCILIVSAAYLHSAYFEGRREEVHRVLRLTDVTVI